MFRKFDTQDWNAYAGAEGDPIIAEFDMCYDGDLFPTTIVADDNGIEINIYDADYQPNESFLMETSSAKTIVEFIKWDAEFDRDILEALGFSKI